MKAVIQIAIVCFFSIISFSALGAKTVLVGLYHFPPFIEAQGSEVSGLAPEIIKLMNEQQDKYYFKALRTLPETRIETFKKGRYDLSMFENIKWGWQDEQVEMSNILFTGGEVYVSRAIAGRDQSFFNDFTDKTMVGIEGYHYAFAGFNADQVYLTKTFNMRLTRSNLRSILVLDSDGNSDIAVISKAYLLKYLHENPHKQGKYLISNKYDQIYEHKIAVRKGANPSVSEVNQILKSLKDSGDFANLFKKLDPEQAYFKPSMIHYD